jgi:hypothetical protein
VSFPFKRKGVLMALPATTDVTQPPSKSSSATKLFFFCFEKKNFHTIYVTKRRCLICDVTGVARFFLVQCTKSRKNYYKITKYPLNTYTQWTSSTYSEQPKYITTFSIPRSSKYTQIGIFGLKS